MGEPDRKVLVTAELFSETFARTVDGRLLSCEWGEPDGDGFYTPVFTATGRPLREQVEALPEVLEVALGYSVVARAAVLALLSPDTGAPGSTQKEKE